MPNPAPLKDFHPLVQRWFARTYARPSPPQVLGWPSISAGRNTLILAPTGSGKTLAAFLWAINHLVEQHLREKLPSGVRILYVSPLKALNNDIERNLVAPLKGIRDEAEADGLRLPQIRTAVRTGDTPQSRRAAMIKHPPDILITTPESLYLLLTSREARRILTTVQYVIIDEIHSICGNKRGVHLSLSLERLQALADQELVRIGLSATQRPLERIAEFLGGHQWRGKTLVPREVAIVDAGRRREMDLSVISPVPDFSLLSAEGVWPSVVRHLQHLIRSHRTTLLFVNNRRLAERLAAKLNEAFSPPAAVTGEAPQAVNLRAVPVRTHPAAGHEPVDDALLVQAYHGSMSRQAREGMERDLKEGKLRALVATSSLELGIDIGSIDLVIQVQSPKGIARGLQRVGRSGHLVDATSKGRIIPTHREDLVEAAVVGAAMARHDVEPTSVPTDCLDVLAQQIVAMVSVEDWPVEKLFDCVRQSTCFRSLSRRLFMSVLQMLGGRYTDETFRELRARISWDRVNNILRALPGSRQLAVTSGGTIADRGAYRVVLDDGKTRVGEVDEEFVYESRVGDTFILGSNVWRMTAIDGNTVSVAPAPGEPARMPFWKGEGIGRSYELGCLVGAFRREMSERLSSADCLSWLQQEYPIDRDAAWSIEEYFRKQHQIAGVVPHDRVILCESFRDEVGDPRTVVHSSFGRRINGLLGMYLLHRLRDISGIEAQMLYNDDGILLRASQASTLPAGLLENVTLKDVEQVILEELPASPLFAGQFRQNAARALLLPKLRPGKRTPLWLQRLKAGDLLGVVRKFEDFPIVMETMREVLNDILDFDHFRELVSALETGGIRVETVETEVPSPFSASLLLDFVAQFMYEPDSPADDHRGQYLTLNREILSELIDIDSLPSLVRPDAVTSVEHQLQHVTDGSRARSAEELMEILLRVGDLADDEITERCEGDAREMLETLRRDRRALPVQFPGGNRWIAGEEQDLYAELSRPENAEKIVRRYLQSHGPVGLRDLAARYGLPVDRARTVLDRLTADSSFIRGRFRSPSQAGTDEMEWCYRPNLERIHRQTVTILRREITPCTIREFTDFLFRWQHLHPSTRLEPHDAHREIISQLQGYAAPQECWERDIFARRIRVPSFDSVAFSDTTGMVLWQGTYGGRIRPLVRGEARAFDAGDEAREPSVRGEAARRILSHLQHHGASFFQEIREGTHLSLEGLNRGLAELFWAGETTNDVFAEVVKVKRFQQAGDTTQLEPVEVVDPRHNPMRSRILGAARRALREVPGWTGRWSLVRTAATLGPAIPPDERAARQAAQLLERYGIVAREIAGREELLPWPLLAAQLQRLELKGEIRRGYFVEGLSGMQFALPAAATLLRQSRSLAPSDQATLLVNACDAGNPFGPGINAPVRQAGNDPARVGRLPGNWLAFRGGALLAIIEGYGSRIRTFSDADLLGPAMREFLKLMVLPDHLRPFREVRVEYIDGERPAASPIADLLRSFGFERGRDQTLFIDAYALRNIEPGGSRGS